jgi:alpha-D-xyloside xylohydrolase
VHGGQRITVAAPIDTIPIFVRAGSILPLGSTVESTNERQSIDQIRVYRGAEGRFTLYSDDGTTYAYEQGKHDITELRWDDISGKLTQTGAQAWNPASRQIVSVIGR